MNQGKGIEFTAKIKDKINSYHDKYIKTEIMVNLK